jgi:hypothetical protein
LVCASAVAALQSRCSFLCVPGLVREALTEAEAVASRALELAGACQEVYLSQPLLTGVSIKQNLSDTQQDDVEAQGGDQMQVDGEQAQHGSGSEGCGELVLTVVEPDAKVKVEVALRLRDLLAHAHPGADHTLPFEWDRVLGRYSLVGEGRRCAILGTVTCLCKGRSRRQNCFCNGSVLSRHAWDKHGGLGHELLLLLSPPGE